MFDLQFHLAEFIFGEYCGNRIKMLIVSGAKPVAEYHGAARGGGRGGGAKW